MPKSADSINKDLEDLLVAKGLDVTSLDSSGKEVPIADEADLFSFHFHHNGRDYGTVTATIDGLQKLTIYYDDEVAKSGSSETDGEGIHWISLVKQLKKFAQRHQLGFVLKDTDRLRQDMKRRQHVKKLEESADVPVPPGMSEIHAELRRKGNDAEFLKNYGKTKQQMRDGLKNSRNQMKSTKDIEEASLDTMRRYYAGDTKARDTTKLSQMRDYYAQQDNSKPANTTMNKQTSLAEGYYGNRKMSYSDDTPTVKMVIKHNRQLEETDQRFRHIEKIFLETSLGERFQVPTNKPSRARMFARHIAEGGQYKDDRWTHITEISEDLDKLGGFVRATNTKREQFNESAQRMISEAVEQYGQLRETVKKLSSSRGYNRYFESYEPRVITEDEGDLSEAFMNSSIDTRIESALPTLKKFGIKMDRLAESDMFAEWADTLVSEALDPDTPRQVEELVELLADMIPVGPNAEVAIAELSDVIEDDELYARLRRTAVADPDSDARPQIIAWMQEQDDEKYRQALGKVEADGSDSESDQEKVKKDNKSDNAEPSKVKPKKPQPKGVPGAAPPGGGLPPLPPLPGGGGSLPPLPPLGEGDEMLESLKRLLGK